MAVLLTGGTGKTSIRLAKFLKDANVPFLLASRKAESEAPSGMEATKFDWLDESTFQNPFDYKFRSGERITSIYLVQPEVPDPVPYMAPFVDLAFKKYNVKRIVMLTGSTTEKNGHRIGKLWQHLDDLGIEYTVLRASWFMENLSEWQYVPTIKNEGKIYTACGDGRIPFISAADIASVAFHALTDTKTPPTDVRVLGPELLTYDDVAVKLGKALGRTISHVKQTQEQIEQRYMGLGMSEPGAKFMAWLEGLAADNTEARTGNGVQDVTGRPPQQFDDWAQKNLAAWQ